MTGSVTNAFPLGSKATLTAIRTLSIIQKTCPRPGLSPCYLLDTAIETTIKIMVTISCLEESMQANTDTNPDLFFMHGDSEK